MTIQTNIANSLTTEILPVVLARPVLSPPRHGAIDAPLFVHLCPWCNQVHLITEELTLFPFVTECKQRLVVVKLGMAVFVGEQLLKPDKQSRLVHVLDHLYREEMKAGHKSRWVEVPRINVPEKLLAPKLLVSPTIRL
jgi:hypothetical protein